MGDTLCWAEMRKYFSQEKGRISPNWMWPPGRATQLATLHLQKYFMIWVWVWQSVCVSAAPGPLQGETVTRSGTKTS